MPFTNHGGVVARLFKNFRQAYTIGGNNQLCIARKDARALLSPRINTRHQAKTGWGTSGRGCMCIGKPYTAGSQTIEVGCLYFCSAIRTYVAITQIISVYINNIWFPGFLLSKSY